MRSDDPVGHYCSRRLFEWTMAGALTMFGLHLLFLPASMAISRFSTVLIMLTVPQLTLVCLLVGGVRLTALAGNGNWPVWGSRLRAGTAMLSAAVWGQLAVALAQVPVGPPSPGVWVYVALTFGEFRSVWRAGRDANGRSGN